MTSKARGRNWQADCTSGWAIGDLDMDDNNLRTIAVELKLAIVNVDYRFVTPFDVAGSSSFLSVPRLAPEFPFPTPFEDCYTALKWVRARSAQSRDASVRL